MHANQCARPDDAIVNPGNPDHFMSIFPARGEVIVQFQGQDLARSTDALRVLEVGIKIYDPVLYIPRTDVVATLALSQAKPTHCPLKGDARYFDLLNACGDLIAPDIAWSYEYTFGFARLLEDLIAFCPGRVTLTGEPEPNSHPMEAPHAQKT